MHAWEVVHVGKMCAPKIAIPEAIVFADTQIRRRTHSHTDTHPLDDEVENDKLALKDEHNLTLLVAIEHRSLEAFGICNGSSKSKRGRSA